MKHLNIFSWIALLLMLLASTGCKKIDIVELTKIKTGGVADITLNSAKISSSFVDVGIDVEEFGHCWSTENNPTISNMKISSFNKPPKGLFTSKLVDLNTNTKYFIRPYAREGDNVIYGSQLSFTTLTIPLTIVAPNSITEWTLGNKENITWEDDIDENVKIELYRDGVYLLNIAANTESDGLYSWSIPTNIPEDNGYSIKISSINDINISKESDKFSLTEQGAILITAPVAGTNWEKGTTNNINWSDNISENVKIDLYKDGIFNSNIADNTASDGTHSWYVPVNLVAGNAYRIKITSVNNNTIFGQSADLKISNQTGIVSDIDGYSYKTVKIGNQWWMAENLKVTHYSNGTAIPLITDSLLWINLGDNNTDKAFCYYNNNLGGEASIYGALYTWAAAMNGASSLDINPSGIRGVCPTGWHLPSNSEWLELINYLGGENISGGKMKSTGNLTVGDGLWTEPNMGATNESGFNGLPGGWRGSGEGTFVNLHYRARWWCTTESSTINVIRYGLEYNSAGCLMSGNYPKSQGYSVRCVKD